MIINPYVSTNFGLEVVPLLLRMGQAFGNELTVSLVDGQLMQSRVCMQSKLIFTVPEDETVSSGVPLDFGSQMGYSSTDVHFQGITMPTMTIEYADEKERVLLEAGIAYFTQLRKTAITAESGTVLDTCERLVLDKGRDMLRSTLQVALQGRIEQAEQKKGSQVLSQGAPRTPQRSS